MKVTWDQGTFRYRGWSEDGHLVAEITSLIGPRGEDRGWQVWLPPQQRDLYRRYPTAEEAIAAAETALRNEPPQEAPPADTPTLDTS
jgi:hypothetical protein